MYRFDPGTTSVSIYFRLRDPNTGLPKTGLTSSSSGALAGYVREQGSGVAITLNQLASPSAAWNAGGFVEVDSVNSPGVYRLDVPNAAFATGTSFCVVTLGFSACIPESVLVRLDKPGSIAGSGAIQATVNVVSGGQPLAGARVWITTDQAGTNVVAGTLSTDSFGNAVFFLNAGPYFVWVQDPGYTGTNPTPLTVS